jgi:hypothetical protein
MFLALSEIPDCDDRSALLERADAALVAFDTGVRVLFEGDADQAIPALFSRRVRALLAADSEGGALLKTFAGRAGRCLARLRADDAGCGPELRLLAGLVGEVLLPLLNRIVEAFEQDLAESLQAESARAADIRAVMAGALDDIEQTGSKIRLIAFNALIEAARAGDAGRAFSVIAEEIKNLGAQTRHESAKMQAAIERLFAA